MRAITRETGCARRAGMSDLHRGLPLAVARHSSCPDLAARRGLFEPRDERRLLVQQAHVEAAVGLPSSICNRLPERYATVIREGSESARFVLRRREPRRDGAHADRVTESQPN